jgi:DNA polymerase-3 subunit epsilon
MVVRIRGESLQYSCPISHPARTPVTPQPITADLFPDLPVFAPLEKPKLRKKPKAAASQPTQPPTPALSAPQVTEPEALACALEGHPDYRVLRRLTPRLHWPDTPGRPGALRLRVVVLDTETTGLDATKDKIIELAMLRFEVDLASGLPVGEVEVFDELEDPGMPIPPEVQALTGIRDADVAGKRLDAQRVADMLDGVDLVIAHNAGFDRPFCEVRFDLFQDIAWACSFADMDWKAQGRSSQKLESLALELGLFYDAHRAEMDCHALLAVLTAPLPKDVSSHALATLIAASRQPAYRLSATGAPFDSKDRLKARGYRWNGEQRVWQTRIGSDAALEAELQWLREQVYGARQASVALEQTDALVRYSSRSGDFSQRSL